jgi:hypothetical protein
VLDPSVETGGLGRLFVTSRQLFIAGKKGGDTFEVFLGRGEAGAPENQPSVVARKTFRYPQSTGVVFLLIIEGSEGNRTNPFDVPVMEVLMRLEAQESLVVGVVLECCGTRQTDVRIEVFCAAARSRLDPDQERIVVV